MADLGQQIDFDNASVLLLNVDGVQKCAREPIFFAALLCLFCLNLCAHIIVEIIKFKYKTKLNYQPFIYIFRI